MAGLGTFDLSRVGRKSISRDEQVMDLPPLPADELVMRLEPNGDITTISERLARSFQVDSGILAGKSFAVLVKQHFTWIHLQLDQWPKELPVMRMAVNNNRVLYFSGAIVAEESHWLIRFVDVTETALRLETSELQGRLFRSAARCAERLRNNSDSVAALDQWLDDFSLLLQLPQSAILLGFEKDLECIGQFPEQEEVPAEILERLLLVPEQTRGPEWKIVVEDNFVVLPFLSRYGQTCWLYCRHGHEKVNPLAGDYPLLQQLFAIIAEPLMQQEREQADRETVVRKRQLESLMSGGWWEVDRATKTISLGETLSNLLGFKSRAVEHLSREQWRQLVAPMDWDKFEVLLLNGADSRLSLTVRLKVDEEFRWYLFEGGEVVPGKPDQITGFALDIHQLRVLESRAEVARSRLQGVVDSAPGIIYVQEYQAGALAPSFYSPKLKALLDWTFDELRDGGFPAIVHSDDRENYFDHIRRLLKSGSSKAQYRLRKRDGSYCWLQDEAVALRDDKGVPTETVGICLDITELRTAMQQVHTSEQKYRALVEDSPAIIFRFTPTFRLTYANRLLVESLELGDSDISQISFSDYLSDEELDRAKQRLAGMTPDSPISVSEVCLTHGDTLCWWVLSERGIFNEEGKLIEIQAVGRDDTELRTAQQQMFQASKLATLGEMAAGLAHEVNQPLLVLHMSIVNLKRRIDENSFSVDYLQTKLDRISSQIQRVTTLVNHMRVFGRETSWKEESFQPANAIDGALILLKQQLEKESVGLNLDIEDGLPEVIGNADRLEQVLINLIVNGIYAAKDFASAQAGTYQATLGISARKEVDRVNIRVADNGAGVSPVIAEKLFDPFFTTKPVGEGTGLGLSLSYSIVKEMSGSLSLEKGEGGATFLISLPVPLSLN